MATRKKTPAADPAASSEDQAPAAAAPAETAAEAPAQPVTSEPVQSTEEVTKPDTTQPDQASPTTAQPSVPGYKAATPILRNGTKYMPGEEVPDLKPDEAERLLAKGFISLITEGDLS